MHKRFIVLITLILILLAPTSAFGQAAPTISNLTISLWPDYDRQGILVIYDITLAATTILPAPMSIRIPKSAGQPYAVASKETNGQLLNLQYDPVDSGTWLAIHFTATQPELRLEYYDPGLTTIRQDHSFTYTWAGDYEVAAMSIEVQQPFGASNMRISSGTVTSHVGTNDGLTYYVKDVGHVAANEQFSLDVSYTKSSDKLSVEDLQIQPSAPLTSSSTLKESLRVTLPWILGGLGVVVIIGGGFWYWQSGRQAASGQKSRKRRRSRASRAEPDTAPPEGAVYCHQCGKRASSSDLFCRSCGARLRVE